MIYTITWALLSTAGAVAVYLLMHSMWRTAKRALATETARAEKLAVQVASLKKALAVQANAAGYYAGCAVSLEDSLRAIELKRHLSAKNARAAQIAQQREKVAQTTAKLQAETSPPKQAMAA